MWSELIRHRESCHRSSQSRRDAKAVVSFEAMSGSDEAKSPATTASDSLHGRGHFENDHADDKSSGVLRAGVFGASDGLVSNTALVMGVAGGTTDTQTIVLAGTAGLLAGAFSMAAGEYVSMRAQREVLERELKLEREHIESHPEEEAASLAHMLADAGLEFADAERMAEKIHENLDPATEFHARFELGIDPSDLGAPTQSAVASFLAFVLGAAVPLIPWIVVENALWPSVWLSALALLCVGAAVTRATRRNPVFGALRQLAFGAADPLAGYTAPTLDF
jgi:VIT1/CCC1 family predicted Fe2+/Mn2+ transporter